MEVPLKVLVVDDNQDIGEALCMLLNAIDIPCIAVNEPSRAIEVLRNETFGLVIQDMNFQRQHTSGQEGIALFRDIKALDPDLPVLLITAWSSVPAAVQMMREGADDYLQKPWDDSYLLQRVKTLLNLRRLSLEKQTREKERRQAILELQQKYELCGLVFEDPAMIRLVELATRISKADVPVLICGPNGCGKEKLAEIVQANSTRTGKPFVKVNVGGLPDDLMESELFGHEAGAFTGATRRRIGRFEAADNGTLFLDEIGNLTPNGQQKLLRVLQTGEFERLGSSQTLKTNVRVISATNANLNEEIECGRFRADLYYRLNVIELEVPPLAKRSGDILPLADFFLQNSMTVDGEKKTFSSKSYQALQNFGWPGNVRELKNKIERAVLIGQSQALEPEDLGLKAGNPDSGKPIELSEVDMDRKTQIERALIQSKGVVSHAAEHLGISRQALYRKMEKLGIELQRFPKTSE